VAITQWRSDANTDREGDTVKAEVNTINRAELAAIKVALEVAPELPLPDDRLATPSPTVSSEDIAARSTLNVATDSLTSMYQIWKWITRPQPGSAGTQAHIYIAGHRTNY
jgi:ribonuclease HI